MLSHPVKKFYFHTNIRVLQPSHKNTLFSKIITNKKNRMLSHPVKKNL